MTSGWDRGYVTDVVYDHGYYQEQSPGQLRLACLLAGVPWDVPAEGAHYLELGCGVGFGALVIAAANPSWRVTALDFHPGHISLAREMAREAGLENVVFLEADLADFAETAAAIALPEADIVTAHGVWSWVAPAVRAGIVRLLRAKLRAGGVFHVSYNALPGWQGLLAVQRLVRETGLRLAGRSDHQAQAGLAVLRELAATEALALRSDPRLAGWLAGSGQLSESYLAHEFMNGNWQPCWHAEVAAALGEARLDWVGHAGLLDGFPELAMTAAQRAVHDRFDDPLARELVKDMCIARTLRHDVYVRGARRMSAPARDAVLRGMTLALAVPEEEVRLEVEVAAGKAEFSHDFYGPVVRMLARGPATVGALLKAPGAVAKRENPTELAGLLVGTRQAVPLARPGGVPAPGALRLNAVLARRFAVQENLNRRGVLASAQIGAGLSCTTADLFLAGQVIAGADPGDMAGCIATLAEGLDEQNTGRVAEVLGRGRDRVLPLARGLGCLPTA